MTTFNHPLDRLAEALEKSSAALSLKPKVWRKGTMVRIYLDSGQKCVKAYFSYSDAEGITDPEDIAAGCKLQVWSDNPKCSRKWNMNTAKQIRHGIATDLQRVAAAGEIKSASLAEPVCESWEDI